MIPNLLLLFHFQEVAVLVHQEWGVGVPGEVLRINMPSLDEDVGDGQEEGHVSARLDGQPLVSEGSGCSA